MAKHRQSYFGGLLLIGLGVLFLLSTLGIADAGELIAKYWPVILILIGISILFRPQDQLQKKQTEFFSDFSTPITQGTGAGVFNISSVFGDIDQKITAQEFRGGFASCTFGDMNLDFSAIELVDGEHIMRLDGVFGDMHVLMPKDIALAVHAKTVFGDVKVFGDERSGIGQEINYTSPDYTTSSKKLRVIANQVFGDVRIW